ncbi:MAG TPA: aconitase X catalytic domain-containing protein [Methanocella sp.]|nr:aconitase X catalytic domain-containing protein [Methanocella sp.]
MYLTREEERIYNGEQGPTLQKMIEILVALGEIYDAEKLIPIKSAQIAGVSYKTIGNAGLEWIRDLEGTVRVPAVLNPMGMDREEYVRMGIDPWFATKQEEIVRAYEKLGIIPECTCTPYYLKRPAFGDHLAWSESSAVCFANSVVGARTNREGGPSALAAALIGRTPYYGLHLSENRYPTVTIKVDEPLRGAEYGALGFVTGSQIGDGIPIFKLKAVPTEDELKHLGAALAASGAVALFHVLHVTPEQYVLPSDRVEIERQMLESEDDWQIPERVFLPRARVEVDLGTLRSLVRGRRSDPDIIALGCPHASKEELEEILRLLHGRNVRKDVWVCTGRRMGEKFPELIAALRSHGIHVLYDTCMVVSPAANRFRCMMVNSGKALKYTPAMCGVDAILGSTEDCIETACRGGD